MFCSFFLVFATGSALALLGVAVAAVAIVRARAHMPGSDRD